MGIFELFSREHSALVETAQHSQPLLLVGSPQPGSAPDAAIRAELGLLAVSTTDCAERSRRLFGKLRKAQGSQRFADLLNGVQYLAHEGEPVGARLLAALLDYSTIADRLVPVLSGLTSARRYYLILKNDRRATNPFGRSWLARLKALGSLPEFADSPLATAAGSEDPWNRLRHVLAASMDELRSSARPPDTVLRVACELFRLEVDALEERASRLAGIVDPFRVAGIQRLLPILSDLDARIRDSRHFISSLESGALDSVFRRPQSRAVEVMEHNEFHQLLQGLRDVGSASVLLAVLRAREVNPRPLPQIAAAVDGLRHLGDRLAAAGIDNTCTDLLGAVQLAVSAQGEDTFEVPLTEEEAAAVGRVLEAAPAANPESGVAPTTAGGAERAFRLEIDRLCAPVAEAAAFAGAWPHGLPARGGNLPQVDSSADPDVAPEAQNFGATEAKKLVLTNLQSLSILLSLLRNPKITAVPGLVAEVATRTRNPQVIVTIANDRSLFTGFANRDVPLACLRNPSNVSVKVLRKLIHVKFVNKIDLKRMSQDRAGVRRELRQEIDNYLATLT